MAANHRCETLMDMARHGFGLRVRCGCGHGATLDASDLSRTFAKRGWDGRMHMVRDRLRCSACGKRPARVG